MHLITRNWQAKPLGMYLVEAGILTLDRVEAALDEQQKSGRRLGEILVNRGWVEQQTIEYLMEKVVLPERRVVREKLSHPDEIDRYSNYNLLNSIERVSQIEQANHNSSLLFDLPFRELQVCLYPKRSIRFLLVAVLCLILASIVGQFSVYYLPDFPLRDSFAILFNVDAELNIPAVFAGFALLICSILLAIIAYGEKLAKRSYVNHWRALSIIFLLMSLDEVIMIHEKTIEPLRDKLNTSGFLYYAWVIPGAIFVVTLLLAFLGFLTALPAKTRQLVLIAGTVYLGGAIGMELVGGYYAELYSQYNITYAIITTVEELLEMLGLLIFI
ncbi:MAG TPA: hypothetical protein DEV81_15645, partial [Cyanobacteria bacterium UBA11049]|nr:hypothetical protein [Cyanobacteria bacterium UBA11049]